MKVENQEVIKEHYSLINGDGLPTLYKNRESYGRVLVNPNTSHPFGNPARPDFPVMGLPEMASKATSDLWGAGYSMERQIRREDIEKGLQFIQSTIPFHGTEDDYKRFLQKLVEDLFTEGNDLYREGQVKLALGQYTEGLNVADYAASDELVLSQELLCRLYVNRSCCYFSMGLFEKSLEDSENALSLDKENLRALYRKAKSLDRLGKHQEAYSCISHRILALVQDESVTELAQELVQKLGLKQRKAYKRPQQELEKFGLITNGISASAGCKASNNTGSVDDIYSDVPNSKLFPSSLGISYHNDGLVTAGCPPSVAPATNNVNDFNDCDVIGDELDSFLDLEMASKHVPQLIPVFPNGNPLHSSLGTTGLPAPSPLPPASFGLLDPRKPPVVPLKSTFAPCLDALDSFDSMRETLDSLDTFVNDTKRVEPVVVKTNHKQKPTVNTVNHMFAHKTDPAQTHIAALPPLLPNPLAQTYDFKQGCQLCYVRTGPKALDFTHKEKFEHKCKKDILLARMKSSENKAWLKIRPRPMKVNFTGPYQQCKDIQSRQDCKYGDNCTFAYYQEEIDVWNEERKGALHRDQLFQLPGLIKPGSVSRLLHDQKGIFTFLCQACFDSKPQIISKRNPENQDVCTNPSNQHSFSDHKCLVHVLNSSTVRYCKIRPNHSRFQMNVCRHEVRYGCHQEDACNFAHSNVELCVWILQRQSGVSQEEIVLESERMWKVSEPKSKSNPKALDMKMKFVCGQCLRNGREIEVDRDGKYCTAKARHSWTKDKRVLLVMSKTKKKWVPIRPLPSIRSFPQQYEICVHVQNGKKCQYIGNCTFAHNTEEKDIWTYMKENKVLDLQLVFDLCNKNNVLSEKPGKTAAAGPQKEAEKQIVMPTDYADLMAGFHCYLCGKNSNSERQWQKHIQSEKHKDRVFTIESEDSSWKYRFPAGEFKLCERYEETQSCPQENNCPFAHGREELAEWHERKKVLQYKVSKARKDMLLEPSDSDFGKYSFIMQDLAEGSEEKGTTECQ
ncbi:zinc finger CCCH domain-containing protein 7B isoform 5-T7 [Leptodactylus fuscus]|uniref:zinc finger CCCH domain-containing protein 7B isoform X2 n=1 Tax=Leptodactylus fuscus TaxID=238119 RepID=UPI003F4E6917